MKKYDRQDHLRMAVWAADCAERVLPFFEHVQPKDDRPREALKVCRTWARTGVFSMPTIRGASLAAHAAARAVKAPSAPCFAARAAGQAVATAHVPQHAFGGAYYALKAVVAANPAHAEANVEEEYRWQAEHSPATLRQEFLKRVVVEKRKDKIFVTVKKDSDF